MKFAVDCMLGTLAKWLRVLGHDVAYFRAIEDGDLADMAAREGRTLLTADRRLVRRRQARDHVLVRSHDLSEQIAQVLRERRLTVTSEPLLGRCLRCNAVTETVAPEAVRDRVPIYVYRTQERFTRCPGCARVYWRATHVTRMLDRLGAAEGAGAKAPAAALRSARPPTRQGLPPARATSPAAAPPPPQSRPRAKSQPRAHSRPRAQAPPRARSRPRRRP
jgi:uncharacterized protein with PIN domain